MKYEKGTFITVPNRKALIGLKPQVQSVYLWLCFHANQDGDCFPSLKALADESGVSRRGVVDAIKTLESIGILQKKTRRKGKVNLSNSYSIVIGGSARYAPPLVHKVHGGSAQSTQGTKTTELNINTATTSVAQEEVFSFSDYIKKMEEDPRRAINIIALYFTKKMPAITNREQAHNEVRRWLRPASLLTPYEDDRLVDTMDWLKKNADFKWTLESVLKYITEPKLIAKIH